MAFTIASSVGASMSAATGRSTQGHLQYAANQGAWWVLYLSGTQSLSALYSTSVTQSSATWSAPSGSPFALANPHLSEGRDFGFGYANISSHDVLHLCAAYATSGSNATYHSRFTLGTTWARTNAEAANFASASSGDVYVGGTATALDSAGKPFDATSYGLPTNTDSMAIAATNADSGTSWTSGWGTAATIFSASADVNSNALASLGSGSMLMVCDNGASTGHMTNLEFSKWTSSWSAAGSAIVSAVTSTTPEAWGLGQVSTSDTHLVVLSNNSNAYAHRRYSGSAWSTGNAIPSLTYGATSGVAVVSDGTNVYIFAIDSSKNIQYCKWSGSSWGSWTVLESARANTPSYVTACYSSAAGGIMVAWTEHNGANYDIIGSFLSTSTAPIFVGAASGGIVSGGIAAESSSYSPAPAGGAVAGGIAIESSAYSPLPSGGSIIGGTAAESFAYSPSSSGGAVLGGLAPESSSYAPAPAGGTALGGTVVESSAYTASAAGGSVLGGIGTESSAYSPAPSGGTALGGVAVESSAYAPAPAGGAIAGGIGAYSSAYSPAPAGGPALGGQAAESSTYTLSPSGGTVLGGTAGASGNNTFTASASGGSTLGGGAVESSSYAPSPAGGAVLGGIAAGSSAYAATASGGSVLGGVAGASGNNTFTATASGGSVLGGIAAESSSFVASPSGGAVIGGTAAESSAYAPSASGGAILGGVAAGSSSYVASASGGIVLGGIAAGSSGSTFTASASGGIILGGIATAYATTPTPTVTIRNTSYYGGRAYGSVAYGGSSLAPAPTPMPIIAAAGSFTSILIG